MYSVISSQSSIQKEVLPSESRDNPATEKLLETVDVKQSRFNHFQVHMYAKFNDPHCIRHVCKPPVQVIFQYFQGLTDGVQPIA